MTKPLKVYTHAEIRSLNLPPRKYLLGEWLEERQPCLVYAQTGRGKSLFAMSLAIAIAGGGSVFGWAADTPKPVLYFDAEMDLADIRDRANMLSPSVEGVDNCALTHNLNIIPRAGQSNDTIFPDLLEDEGQELLLSIIDEHKPAIVFIDNLTTMAEFKDENDSSSFSPIIRLLWGLRKRDCAVVIIHHTGKKEGNYRGSSKLATTFESILQLARNDDLLTGDTGFMIKVDKYRGANEPKPIKVKLEVSTNGKGSWLYEDTGHKHLEELVACVRSRELSLGNDIAAHLHISKGEVSKRKRKAIQLGLITNDEWNQCLQDARDTRRELGEDEDNTAKDTQDSQALDALKAMHNLEEEEFPDDY